MAHHILTSEQFTGEDLTQLFQQADQFRDRYNDPAGRRELTNRYIGHQMVSLFYEASTRTRLSFEIAAKALGIGVSGTENARIFSSATKGESLEDTVRVLDEYGVDIIVLRHDKTGGAARAAAVSKASIINAGDGKGEHPTQALLDLYTIQQTQGRTNNLHIAIGGDLLHGRTARSLAKLLALQTGNSLSFVSIPELQMDQEIKSYLRAHDTPFSETDDMHEAFRGADVVYWTRLQRERLERPEAIPSGGFVIDQASLSALPQHATIMHPLPRAGEIDPSIDDDPRAKYFQQAGNGLYIRMALIEKILSS